MVSLVKVLHTVTPSETHFVYGNSGTQIYFGVLAFWVIAVVTSGDNEEYTDMFPIVGAESVFEEQLKWNMSAYHWSAVRDAIDPKNISGEVDTLLRKLWGEM